MLPGKRIANAGSKKSAFGRALERFRTRDVTAAAAQMDEAQPRRTAGLNEVFHVTRCAVTGRYFKVLYRRSPEDGKFVPVMQIKVEHLEAHARLAGGSGAPAEMIAIEEFRYSSPWPCPWCGKKTIHAEIRCNLCQRWTCTGRSYLNGDGEEMYVCHKDCGSHAKVGKTPAAAFETEQAAGASLALLGVRRTVVAVETTVLLVRMKKL